MKWFFVALSYLVLAAAAVYCDLYLLLYGGIVSIVHGLNVSPANGSDIGWGVVRICCSGVGLVAAFIIGMIITAVALERPVRRRVRARR